VILFWLGWLLIFLGQPQAVVNPETGLPADLMERIYFTGFTISTLGVGDFHPQGAFWQIMTSICTLSGFFLLTFIISFFVSISEEQAFRYRLATYLYHAGRTPQKLILTFWDEETRTVEQDFSDNLLDDVVQFEQRHQHLPLLHRFHGPTRKLSVEINIVVLDEALSIMMHSLNLPITPSLRLTREAISGYLANQEDHNLLGQGEPPPIPSLDELRQRNLPVVSDEQYQQNMESIADRRHKLQALVERAGFQWSEVFEDPAA
jgi:hypothetical protein